jgi:hypothetical protein
MDISNPATQQSGLAPLYPQQTQQQLKSEAQSTAETENPVENAKEVSNEQAQPRTESTPQQNSGQIDTYA